MSLDRRGSHAGPVSRNYNVTTTGDLTTEVWRAGVLLSSSTGSAESRASRLDVNNPWRQQKPPGLDPTARTLNWWKRDQPRLIRYTKGTGGRINKQIGYYNNPINAEWDGRYLSPTWNANDEQLRTEAILQALAKVKDQKWNAGVALAESAGVATMAVDAMALVTRTRQLIRKGDLEQAYREFREKTKYMSYPEWRRKFWRKIRHIRSVKQSKRIPSGWLYYHFGIKPTIDDISSAVEAFQTKTVPLLYGGALFVKGYAKHTQKVSSSASGGRTDFSVLRSVRVKIRVTPKNELLARAGSLGITNPPEAVWNAIPFSWLVDQFTNIGSWLGALDTSLGWTFATHWEESWRTVANSIWTPVSSASVWYGYPLEKGSIHHKNITRNIRGDLYGPMGSILPTVKRRGPSLQQYTYSLSVLATSMRQTIRP